MIRDKLREIYAAYENWVGEPTRIIEFRREEVIEEEPNKLDVLFFQPPVEETLTEDEYFTYVATAGLSAYAIPRTSERVELILSVCGYQLLQDLQLLASELAELAVVPFREDTFFSPNVLLSNIHFSLFERMNHALITDWGVNSPEFLPGIQPPVRLLSIIPVYESEARVISSIGVTETYQLFRDEGVNLDDPKREPARLRGLTVEANTMYRRETMQTDLSLDIQKIWSDIEQWYSNHAANLLEDLNNGISDQVLTEFESQTGLTIPEDYKTSLKIHNGDVYFHSYCYQSLEGVLKSWLLMKQQVEAGAFEGRQIFNEGEEVIQNIWWCSRWIPFAEDSGGNFICIDLEPASQGIVGQIIKMEVNAGPVATEYESFFEWLKSYRDDLYKGLYEVDEDGYLFEKD
jgi:cell wall assembly regulator SMI1